MNEEKIKLLKYLDKRIGEILLFDDGWDGSSGKKFNEEFVNEFYTLVKSLIDKDLLTASFFIIPYHLYRDGQEIKLEIMHNNTIAIEFRIGSLKRKYLWLYIKKDEDVTEEEFEGNEATEKLIEVLTMMKET